MARISFTQALLPARGGEESLPFPADSFDAAIVDFGIRNLTPYGSNFFSTGKVSFAPFQPMMLTTGISTTSSAR